jgi:hypothetical protein
MGVWLWVGCGTAYEWGVMSGDGGHDRDRRAAIRSGAGVGLFLGYQGGMLEWVPPQAAAQLADVAEVRRCGVTVRHEGWGAS